MFLVFTDSRNSSFLIVLLYLYIDVWFLSIHRLLLFYSVTIPSFVAILDHLQWLIPFNSTQHPLFQFPTLHIIFSLLIQHSYPLQWFFHSTLYPTTSYFLFLFNFIFLFLFL